MKKTDVIIAIDPDCAKSGVAVLKTNEKTMTVYSLSFPELIDKLGFEKNWCKSMGETLQIIVEAGWLNKSNWHLTNYDSKFKAASKGNAVGRNHETGRKIVEMAKYNGLDVYEVKPLKKVWSGPEGKISHDEISKFIPLEQRSNQETRDAALLAWVYAGLPIKMKPVKS